jgi:hypothetical protein
MIYLKSVLAGLAAMFLATILFPFAFGTIALFFQSQPSAGSTDKAIVWDLRSALGSPLFLWSFALTVVFFFGIGFWWEFRRASR